MHQKNAKTLMLYHYALPEWLKLRRLNNAHYWWGSEGTHMQYKLVQLLWAIYVMYKHNSTLWPNYSTPMYIPWNTTACVHKYHV